MIEEEAFWANKAGDGRPAWDIDFSRDPAQTFVFDADGENRKVWILRRDTLNLRREARTEVPEQGIEIERLPQEETMRNKPRAEVRFGFVLWGTIGILALPALAAAQQVTFTKDIAAIFQQKCQTCHRPGTVAPMSLVTFDEVRPYARAIKDKVSKRIMPPWPIDTTIGVQGFKNDISLSDKQIATIVKWVDSGAPRGDMKDMPAPVTFPDVNAWNYENRFGRPPDLVITSTPYTAKAGEIDQWPTPEVKIPLSDLSEERWIRAIELRPGNTESRYAFHHANPSLIPPTATEASAGERQERYQLTDSAVGTEGFIYPADAGKKIVPGSAVSFGMHLWPLPDRDVDVILQVGLWFYPKGEKPKYDTEGEVQFWISQGTRSGKISSGGPSSTVPGFEQFPAHSDLLIPPNSIAMIRGVHVLKQNARVHSLRGHMHFRGKNQIVEVIYPDGRWETINKLDWDHGWHTAFLYNDDKMPLLPKGTTIILHSIFDNTKANRYNPDPDQWVAGGRRSADEMSHLRMGVTYLKDEDFNRMVEERKRLSSEKKAPVPAAQQAANQP